MKKFFLLSLLAVLTMGAKAQNSNDDIVKVGDAMPSFSIISDNGNVIKSSQFKGKVVLINFFATWCPPCQKELAAVQQTLWPKYKNNGKFVMLVIGREHSDKELVTYNEKKGFAFPLYPDKNRKIYSSFAKSLIPRSYLIDKSGKVIYAGKGYTDKEFTELMEKIEKTL